MQHGHLKRGDGGMWENGTSLGNEKIVREEKQGRNPSDATGLFMWDGMCMRIEDRPGS